MVLSAGCPRSVGVIVGNWIQKVKVPAVPLGLGAVVTNDECMSFTAQLMCRCKTKFLTVYMTLLPNRLYTEKLSIFCYVMNH